MGLWTCQQLKSGLKVLTYFLFSSGQLEGSMALTACQTYAERSPCHLSVIWWVKNSCVSLGSILGVSFIGSWQAIRIGNGSFSVPDQIIIGMVINHLKPSWDLIIASMGPCCASLHRTPGTFSRSSSCLEHLWLGPSELDSSFRSLNPLGISVALFDDLGKLPLALDLDYWTWCVMSMTGAFWKSTGSHPKT